MKDETQLDLLAFAIATTGLLTFFYVLGKRTRQQAAELIENREGGSS